MEIMPFCCSDFDAHPLMSVQMHVKSDVPGVVLTPPRINISSGKPRRVHQRHTNFHIRMGKPCELLSNAYVTAHICL